MNEEQLTDLLNEHLDAFLAGEPLPETAPDEVVELLGIAQSLSEIAPAPRPEFGPALKESLLGPTGGGSGPPPAANSPFNSSILFIVVIGLLVAGAGLAVVISLTIFASARSSLWESPPTTLPGPTQTVQAQHTPEIQTPAVSTPAATATTPTRSAGPGPSLRPTATPIIDVLPAITVTVEIRIDPPDLVPGSGGGDSDGGSGSGGGDNDDDDNDDDDGDD